MFKKTAFSIFISFLLFFGVLPGFSKVHAQIPTPAPPSWYNSSFQEFYGKVYGDESPPSEIFGERYTTAQVQWVVYGLMSFIINQTMDAQAASCLIQNMDALDECAALFTASIDTPPSFAEKPQEDQPGLLSLVFEDRSFSGIGYVRQKAQTFSLVPTVNAQEAGFGFDALLPIQKMWQASRDMAFGLFVIVAIIFAFMIMFRVKISPQLVISVQSALPKIVGALILVTFSYAIAGFLIDLMYVVYGIISVMGRSFVPIGNASAAGLFEFLTKGRLGVMASVGGGLGEDFGVLGLYIFYLLFFCIALAVVLFLTMGAFISTIAGAALLAVIFTPLGPLLGWLAVAIIIIAVLIAIWNGFKILWALLKAFTNILLLTIFAPLQIVIGALVPSFGFGQWVKSFASNLAVFVVTSVLFLFAYIFLLLGIQVSLQTMGGAGGNILQALLNSFANFVLGSAIIAGNTPGLDAWPPLAGGGGGIIGLLMLGVSFVMYTLIPKATEIVQGLISGKPFAYGTAIGEAVAVAPWLYGASGAKETVGMATRAYRQGALEKFFAGRGEGPVWRAIENLEKSRGTVGNVTRRVVSNIEEGVKRK